MLQKPKLSLITLTRACNAKETELWPRLNFNQF